MEEAEVEELEPKVLEFVEAEGEVTEKAILAALQPVRAIIVSRSLRTLFQDGKVERTGRGRRGSPFLYSMAASLDLASRESAGFSS